ncbi:MAG: metalloregulator ArsR/SmtB family transcription factor [Planctomycetota bacterium]
MQNSRSSTADLLKVLADETRLHVVRELMRGPQRVYELNAGLGIDQSLLSHHLRVLREAGLATCRRDGKAMLYRLSDEVLADQNSGWLDVGVCRIQFGADGELTAKPEAEAAHVDGRPHRIGEPAAEPQLAAELDSQRTA